MSINTFRWLSSSLFWLVRGMTESDGLYVGHRNCVATRESTCPVIFRELERALGGGRVGNDYCVRRRQKYIRLREWRRGRRGTDRDDSADRSCVIGCRRLLATRGRSGTNLSPSAQNEYTFEAGTFVSRRIRRKCKPSPSAPEILRPRVVERILYSISIQELAHAEDLRRIFNSSSTSTMPPPFEHEAFHLTLLPNAYFVKQLPTSSELPENVLSLLNGPGFFSITRTSEEISIVGEITDDPRVQSLSGGVGEWRCIKIAGPMEFGNTPRRLISDRVLDI